MQSVQFTCSQCGKLMAVGSEFAGQQVRCPHCQQVVTAPSAESPAASEAEDIFSPNEVSDDLFGRPSPPRLEIIPEPPAPTLPDTQGVSPPAAAPEPDTTLTATAPELPSGALPPPPIADGSTTALPPAEPNSPWMAVVAAVMGDPKSSAPSQPDVPASDGMMLPTILTPPPPEAKAAPEPFAPSAAAELPRTPRRSERKTPWLAILVISPLVLYSLVVTLFAVMLYLHQRNLEQRRRDPFEMMPDDGDDPGTRKGQPKERHTYIYDPKLTTRRLPDHLRTPLGKPLRIGDLLLTPERVERKRVRVIVEGFQPEPCLGDSLVLYLTMENLSKDRAFAPLDNYFDRHWERGHPLPPLTVLEAGSHRFYGGPAEWRPRGARDQKREWVEGRKSNEADLLQPGEIKKEHFFVCTDGNNAEATRVLFGGKNDKPYQGEYLWRIRLRRGRVRWNDKDYSATAVVGVEFSAQDIQAVSVARAALDE